MLHLSALDFGVTALFVALIFALGFSTKLRDHSILQYLAAGRALSAPAFVATLVSTWYGGILGVGESVQTYGVGTLLLLGVPYYVFALIYAVFLAKRVRAAEQISIPERLANRWGKNVGLLSAGLIFLLAVPAAHVLMLGVLLHSITGLNQTSAIVVATLCGTLFLYKGGLLADVRVGMLAFVSMYIGFAIIVVYCLIHYPLAKTIHSLDPKLLDWTGGSGPITVLGFFFLGAWTLVDPGFHQRVASARDPATGREGVLISIFFWFLFDMLSMTAALYAIALVKPAPDGLYVYQALADQVLPSGLKGLFVCGVLGTVLSAMVAYTLVSGATLGREVYARWKGDLSESEVKLWTRFGFFVACVVAVLLAVNIHSVLDLWYQWGGAVTGALLIPVVVAYIPSLGFRASSKCVFVSMAAAFIVSFGWLVYGKRTENPYLEVSIAGQTFGLGTLIPGLVVSAIVLAVGQVAARRMVSDG